MMTMWPILFVAVVGVLAALTLIVYAILRGNTACRMLVTAVLGLFLAGYVGTRLTPYPYDRERGRRADCAGNLHQIGIALQTYAADHSGCAPHTLGDLGYTLDDPKILICKSSGNKAGAFSNAHEWSDYIFIPPATNRKILAFCPAKNHNGAGGTILWVDGSVSWYNAEDLADIRQKAQAQRP
jgi:prepilin-type processing-associated H-X9-DG protein